jgi:hypothetical protein
MVRILIASMVAATAVFTWGAAGWMGGLWEWGVQRMPISGGVNILLSGGIGESGAYAFPPMPFEDGTESDEVKAANLAKWQQEHRDGPSGMVLVRVEGSEPFDPKVFARGFAIEWAASLMLAILATLVRGGFGRRLLAGTVATLFAVAAVHGVSWNFLLLPDSYAAATALDSLVGWMIAATLCAAIIPGPPRESYGISRA